MAIPYLETETELAGRLPEDTDLETAPYTELESNEHPLEYKENVSIYQPALGTLVQEKTKPLNGGEVHIGTYYSKRAWHKVGIYVPDGHDPDSPAPVVVKTTPLGVSAAGHAQSVAEEMMRGGAVVIKKGPPRYYGLTAQAVGLAEDANELLGLTQAVDQSDLVGRINDILVYGESQAAMKGLFVVALARHYGFDLVNGHLVAPCYIDRIDFRHPLRELGNLVNTAGSIINFAARALRQHDTARFLGTFNIKDMHHHAIVIPILMSGETGESLPYIDREQKLTVSLFGKDGHSNPYLTRNRLVTMFPNMDVVVKADYGHVDGIMSHETRVLRDLMVTEATYRLGKVAVAA